MIFDSTLELIENYHPDILAIEEPFYGKNPQSMLKLGRAQGVVIGACLHAGLEVYEYTPRRIKQAITGKGAASKEQVAAMLHSMYTFSTETKYLDAFQRLADIKSDMIDFVESGRNLYICSEAVGTGKTSWALKLLMRYFEEVWDGNGCEIRGVIVHVPTFLMKCKDFKTVDEEFEKLKRTLLDVDLVVWDDIGGITVSGYDYAQLLMYLDARDFKDLANIYTSNLTTRESFNNALGAKITSRVWSSKTEVIQFFGEERR